MEFRVGYATDVGRKRSQNQDNLVALPELGLFVVADGMGGHRGGEIASAMAIEIISNTVKKGSQKDVHPRGLIVDALLDANSAIYERACKESQLQGMGTTTTALLFHDNTLTIGHVGDSRCYFMRPHLIWQATRDHSWVQEKLRAGLITREEVKTDRMKNVITRSVGFEPGVNVEIYEMKIKTGDSFLVCSDGLTGLVEDGMILDLVQTHLFEDKNPEKTVASLIEAANENGGDDNITTLVVEVL